MSSYGKLPMTTGTTQAKPGKTAPKVRPSLQDSAAHPVIQLPPDPPKNAVGVYDYADAAAAFGPAFNSFKDALGNPITPAATPVFGARVQGYGVTPWNPTFQDPKAVEALFASRPLSPNQGVGGNVEDQIRTQALARKAALEEKLKALDAGYSQASDQIHGGYQAVGQLLAQAQGNYTQGMAGVTAGQAQGNNAVAQSGLLQSDAVAKILASQGVAGVGADQAAATAGSAQAGANDIGATAAGGLATGQSTLNTFFSGLPSLAAMGEAGGIGQLSLIQALTRARATGDSADAGLAADAGLRAKELDYQRQLASQDVQAQRARDDSLLSALTGAQRDNVGTKNQAGQYNSGQTTQAAATLAGAQNSEASRVATDRTQAAANAAAASANAQNNLRQQQIELAKWKVDNDLKVQAAVLKATHAGVSPASLDKYTKSQAFVVNKVSDFVNRGGASLFNSPVPGEGQKYKNIPEGFIKNDGTLDPTKFPEWQKTTGGTTDDLLIWLAYQTQSPDSGRKVSYAQAQGIIKAVAQNLAVAADATAPASAGSPSQAYSEYQATARELEKSLKRDFDIYTGRNQEQTQYVDHTTGRVVTLAPVLPALLNQARPAELTASTASGGGTGTTPTEALATARSNAADVAAANAPEPLTKAEQTAEVRRRVLAGYGSGKPAVDIANPLTPPIDRYPAKKKTSAKKKP